MSLLVISASNRAASQSVRIAAMLAARLEAMWGVAEIGAVEQLHLRDVQLPIWDESKWKNGTVWTEVWTPISQRLAKAQGFVIVCPEWGGMAPPQLKNLLLLCEDGELAHKPAQLVSVSASTGGAYVVAELRMSGYKNNQLLWLPDHVIIRNAESFAMEDNGDAQNARLLDRIDYTLRLLIAYAQVCRRIRENLIDPVTYHYGM